MPETLRRKPRHSALPVGREFRRFATQGLEVRSADGGGNGIVITGTPIVYNTPYSVFDMFGEFEETMMPGVASTVIGAGADVRFLFNHDGLPLARTLSGTLAFNDSATGLGIVATLDSRQQLANDLAVAIERGDVTQMSCGFRVGLDVWNDDETQRSIYRLDELFDVSAVTYPASPTTTIELALRSMLAAPVESRARIRRAYKTLRAGKVLSAQNQTLLQDALEALHEADDVDIPSIVSSLQTIDAALDAGQAGLAEVLGKADPDDDDESTDSEDGTDNVSDDENGITDGTGQRSSAPATKDERRAATGSYNDIQRAVNDALQKAYGDPESDWCDLWIEDCSDTWVVFESYETPPGVGMWQQDYSRDADGVVTLVGDPVQVVSQSTYVPVEPVAPASRARNVPLELEAERLRLAANRRRYIA